jgi:hypothetical protein
MATDLTISEAPKARTRVSCNYAQHCLWFEVPTTSSTCCTNRNSLVCQKHCEEVFGHEESQGKLKLATSRS